MTDSPLFDPLSKGASKGALQGLSQNLEALAAERLPEDFAQKVVAMAARTVDNQLDHYDDRLALALQVSTYIDGEMSRAEAMAFEKEVELNATAKAQLAAFLSIRQELQAQNQCLQQHVVCQPLVLPNAPARTKSVSVFRPRRWLFPLVAAASVLLLFWSGIDFYWPVLPQPQQRLLGSLPSVMAPSAAFEQSAALSAREAPAKIPANIPSPEEYLLSQHADLSLPVTPTKAAPSAEAYLLHPLQGSLKKVHTPQGSYHDTSDS